MDEKPSDKQRIDWLQANPNVEYTHKCEEDKEWWVFHRSSGNVNDREWDEIARGFSFRAAVDAAMIKD